MTLFFVLLVVLLIGFIHYHLLKEKTKSILCGTAFLLVCGLIALLVHNANDGYTYEPNVDIAKLEAFRIDLDSLEQYEEWFRPDERKEMEEYTLMSRMISLEDEPYRLFDVRLEWHPDEQAAIESYERYLQPQIEVYSKTLHTTKRLDANYDYYFSKIYSVDIEDYFFLVLPSSYSFYATIRYKNVIFTFWEDFYRRESRVDEVIDQLLAEYEQYKAGL